MFVRLANERTRTRYFVCDRSVICLFTFVRLRLFMFVCLCSFVYVHLLKVFNVSLSLLNIN
ncbi:hypothetical protein Hanom_Chr03g00230651 [Helianthus anomalus]